jgi:hypothetical protein
MNKLELYAWISFVLACFAYVPYVWMTLKSTTKPTVASWICWFMMDFAILAATYLAGANYLQMVAFVMGTTFVISACFYKKAMVGWTKTDSFCTVMVAIAIGLWALSGSPEFAIVISLTAMTIGSYPMWKNIWIDPSRESLLPWSIVMASTVFSLLAAKSWTITEALTPVWFLIIQAFTILLISRKYK